MLLLGSRLLEVMVTVTLASCNVEMRSSAYTVTVMHCVPVVIPSSGMAPHDMFYSAQLYVSFQLGVPMPPVTMICL